MLASTLHVPLDVELCNWYKQHQKAPVVFLEQTVTFIAQYWLVQGMDWSRVKNLP